MAKVTPKQIWDALEKAGASSVQAAGIMGNMIAESALDPEVKNASSGATGLVQWNPADYDTSGLVTGDPQHDMQTQINFLARTGGFKAASGTTVKETASNFSAKYERCAGCQEGGSSNAARQANAATVAGWASAGSWPKTSGGATDTAVLTSAQVAAQTQAQKACLWSVGWGGIPDTSWFNSLFGGGSGNVASGEVCLLSKSQARSLMGVALIWGGTAIILIGVNWVIIAAAGPKILQVAGMLIAPEAAAPVKALGAARKASAAASAKGVSSKGKDTGQPAPEA
ncbi:MAG TPA: phage tail tip lysozyme [Streptosporangiaceae bacterium]|nr:phage tail tip lysozyme [Streptosporangiaceae bacterium]